MVVYDHFYTHWMADQKGLIYLHTSNGWPERPYFMIIFTHIEWLTRKALFYDHFYTHWMAGQEGLVFTHIEWLTRKALFFTHIEWLTRKALFYDHFTHIERLTRKALFYDHFYTHRFADQKGLVLHTLKGWLGRPGDEGSFSANFRSQNCSLSLFTNNMAPQLLVELCT